MHALDIAAVREIIRLQPVTGVPDAPAGIAGVISLRNRVIPVIDLRSRFHLPAGADDAAARIIIADLDGATVGIKVDAVLEVLRLDREQIEPLPELAAGQGNTCLRGVARWRERLILLLEASQLLSAGEKEDLKAAGGAWPPGREKMAS